MAGGLPFTVTDTELGRVKIAAAAGMALDPRGPPDAKLIVVLAVLYAITLAAAAFALYNRNYPPLRCKMPALMACIVVSGSIWLMGDSQANGHVPLHGTPLANCKAFGLWMRIMLGVYTVSVLWAARVYGLYRVFGLGRPFRGHGVYIPAAVYLAVLMLFGIVVQALPADKTLFYMPGVDICNISRKLLAVVFVLLWLNFGSVFVLSWMLRNIKSSFNEKREAGIACLIVFSILVYETIIHYASPRYPFNITHRLVTTCVDHIGTLLYWWLLMAEPLFNCAFRHQRYLDTWMAKLVEDGLELQYDVDCADQHNVTTMCQNSVMIRVPSKDSMGSLCIPYARSSGIITLSRYEPPAAGAGAAAAAAAADSSSNDTTWSPDSDRFSPRDLTLTRKDSRVW